MRTLTELSSILIAIFFLAFEIKGFLENNRPNLFFIILGMFFMIYGKYTRIKREDGIILDIIDLGQGVLN